MRPRRVRLLAVPCALILPRSCDKEPALVPSADASSSGDTP